MEKHASGAERVVLRCGDRQWHRGQVTPCLPASPRRLLDPQAAGAWFAALAQERVEVLAFVYLGAGQQVLGMRHARSRYRDRLDLPIRAIAADALAFDALAIVMAHNHPSGDPTPSEADRAATRRLARALDPLGIRLLDHLVVAARGTTSFRSLGFL